MDWDLLGRLVEAERYFTSDRWKPIVSSARRLFESGRYDKCEARLSSLPTPESLLDELVEKLKGKSVYRTLRRITEGRADDPITRSIGLTSLMTHILLEMKNRPEYGILLKRTVEQASKAIYEI